MKFVDAYILAATKRKTRRIRTALVVIVSSLLFAVLFFLAFVGEGMINSAKQVQDVGFNGNNLVTIISIPKQDSTNDGMDEQKKIEAAMDAELKARKIKVTNETKNDPSYQMEMGKRMSNFFMDIQKKENVRAEEQAKTLGKPTAIYHFSSLPINAADFRYEPDAAKDTVVEELTEQEETGVTKQNSFGGNGEVSYHVVEGQMLKPQLQPGQSFDWKPGEAYPVAISYAYMEKLADKSFANISGQDKIQGYRELMKQFAGQELDYCYRNSAAQAQLQDVIHYNKLARTDKDTKTNPIAVPVCGGFDQALLKKLKVLQEPDKDAPKPLFPAPVQPAPETKTVRLKIVAFVPSMTQYGQDFITQMISSLAMLPTYTPYPIIFSSEVVAQDPLLNGFVSSEQNGGFFYQQVSLFADFKDRGDQQAFLAQSCKGSECNLGEKPIITPFGNIHVALEGIFEAATKFILIAVGIIMVIAGLMIMFTISKVIADSTKEIAVFRALGARRRDIAHIYYTYGGMLTVSAALLSAVLASIGAVVATNMYGERVAIAMVQGVGAYNTDVHVALFGIRPQWILMIVLAMAAAAILGISVPLLASLRRKLITILREE